MVLWFWGLSREARECEVLETGLDLPSFQAETEEIMGCSILLPELFETGFLSLSRSYGFRVDVVFIKNKGLRRLPLFQSMLGGHCQQLLSLFPLKSDRFCLLPLCLTRLVTMLFTTQERTLYRLAMCSKPCGGLSKKRSHV